MLTEFSALTLLNPEPLIVITVQVPGGPPWPLDGLIDVIFGVDESLYVYEQVLFMHEETMLLIVTTTLKRRKEISNAGFLHTRTSGSVQKLR